MKAILFTAALATLSAVAAPKTTLRVMSYNVHNCVPLNPSIQSPEADAAVIRAASPDIVGVQELDRWTTRSHGRDIAQELATASKMELSYSKSIDFQGGAYGIGALSKEVPLRSYNIPLPGPEEKRSLLVVEFDKYVFFNTHLSLNKNGSLESVPLINAEADKFKGKAVVLVGDFNVKPDSEVIREFKKTWQIVSADAPTFPAFKPRVRIDFILVRNSKPVKVSDASVIPEGAASDHRPIIATISF